MLIHPPQISPAKFEFCVTHSNFAGDIFGGWISLLCIGRGLRYDESAICTFASMADGKPLIRVLVMPGKFNEFANTAIWRSGVHDLLLLPCNDNVKWLRMNTYAALIYPLHCSRCIPDLDIVRRLCINTAKLIRLDSIAVHPPPTKVCSATQLN